MIFAQLTFTTIITPYTIHSVMSKAKETFVRLRNDVARAINYMLAEQGTMIAGVPGVSLSRSAYINELVINDLSKRGHFPPKDRLPEENVAEQPQETKLFG